MQTLTDSITAARELLDAEPPRILLAEDDADMRKLVAAMLRKRGYEVIEARDGAQLAAFVNGMLLSGTFHPPPDLIVSDICMPGFSGLEVVTALRRLDWRTRVVLLTGFGDAEVYEAARKLGVDGILDKPFDLEVLAQKVEQLVPIV